MKINAEEGMNHLLYNSFLYFEEESGINKVYSEKQPSLTIL